jgi:hypothetical protein
MKKSYLGFGFFLVILFVTGCKSQQSDNDAIRAGILQHLRNVGTLDMNAMVMDLKNASVNGNQAHADVEFRPKTGAPPGAGMQVTYNLEKRDGAWVVLKTQAAGGMIEHPAPGQNPHQSQNVHGSQLPNFSELVNPAAAPATGTLPPGHPPISSTPNKVDQSSTKKQR